MESSDAPTQSFGRGGRGELDRFVKEFEPTIASIQALYLTLKSLDTQSSDHDERRRYILSSFQQPELRAMLDSKNINDFYNFYAEKTGISRGILSKVLSNATDRIIFAKNSGHMERLKHGDASASTEFDSGATLKNVEEVRPAQANKDSNESKQSWLDNLPANNFQESKNTVNQLSYGALPGPDWIRLLVIEPGNLEDEMVCHLHNVQREDVHDRYEALSYYWEESVQIHWYEINKTTKLLNNFYVSCNGFKAKVGANLWVALQYIRRKESRRVIWVDQLCINQEDAEERGAQVKIMGSIYSNASKTLVWLGESSYSTEEDRENALRLLCQIVNHWRPEEAAHFWIVNTGSTEETLCEPDRDLPSIDDWHCLTFLSNAQWFRRRWVIQEVVRARQVELLWHGSRILWRYVGLAAAVLRTQHDPFLQAWNMGGVYNAYLVYRLADQDALRTLQQRSFLHLLRLTSGFTTSEPRDVAYALLGISAIDNNPEGQQFIQPDYNLTKDEVLRQIAEKLLTQQSSPLSFLSNVDFRAHPTQSSWIPHWKRPRVSMLSPWLLNDSFDPAKGLDFRRMEPSSPSNTSHLAVEGIQVSTVTWTVDAKQTVLRALISSGVFHTQSPRGTDYLSNSTITTLACTLCAGKDAYGERDRSVLSSHFAAWLVAEMGPESKLAGTFSLEVEPGTLEAAKHGDAGQFYRLFDGVGRGRSLFVTVGGHLGIGPSQTAPGDVLCIFGGAKMPFIIRKQNEFFAIVGECYVDDIMYGEAVTAIRVGRTKAGPFDPEKLMRTLYDFDKVDEKVVDILEEMMTKVMEIGRKEYECLKAITIELC